MYGLFQLQMRISFPFGGRGGGPNKMPAEDLGSTPEGRGESQSPQAVGGKSSPSVFFYSVTYAKRGGGADTRAESRQNLSNPVERPPCRPLPRHPLLDVPGRLAAPPIGAGAYVPIRGGVWGHGGRHEAEIWDGCTALRQVE